MGCHFLLQGVFLTQGSNPHLLHLLYYRQILTSEPPGKPELGTKVDKIFYIRNKNMNNCNTTFAFMYTLIVQQYSGRIDVGEIKIIIGGSGKSLWIDENNAVHPTDITGLGSFKKVKKKS